jgi:prepilin-type N-terminal cleavage/methylation domain-containing protein
MSRVRVRFGFTLIELLVVIAIIAVLIGLLVPAVQKVRQAASKMSCSNNLHQIAIAAANYESANGVLPPGANFNQNVFGGSFIGCLPYLLPYVEQDPVFKQIPANFFDVNQTNQGFWDGNAAALAASQVNIKTFMCPSDNPFVEVQNYTFLALILYGPALTLYGYYDPNTRNIPFGKSNYAASGGAIGSCASASPFYNQFCGPYYGDSRNKTSNINDGSSNTIGFGELLGGTSGPSRDWNLSWMGSGAQATAWQLLNPAQWYTFGSFHTAGVQFAMCDGSVKTMSRVGSGTNWFSTPWYNFMYASGQNDGQVITWATLEP